MKGWINKPVSFKLTDPDDMELYQYARSLDNFTALVKRWLRELREGVRSENWGAPEMLSREITQTESDVVEDVDENQFL